MFSKQGVGVAILCIFFQVLQNKSLLFCGLWLHPMRLLRWRISFLKAIYDCTWIHGSVFACWDNFVESEPTEDSIRLTHTRLGVSAATSMLLPGFREDPCGGLSSSARHGSWTGCCKLRRSHRASGQGIRPWWELLLPPCTLLQTPLLTYLYHEQIKKFRNKDLHHLKYVFVHLSTWLINLSTTLPCADIVDSNFARRSFTKSFGMSINKICDIYVVPNTSTVSSRVVCSSDLDGKDMTWLFFIFCSIKLMHARMSMLSTFSPGMVPAAASKQAPEILPCSRNSGLGASPRRPSGSDPITLKYLIQKKWEVSFLYGLYKL
jgi:hypothetical protein